jgi:hypothetical protein
MTSRTNGDGDLVPGDVLMGEHAPTRKGTVEIHLHPRALVAIDGENIPGFVRDLNQSLLVGEHVVRVWSLTGQNKSYKFYMRPGDTYRINEYF